MTIAMVRDHRGMRLAMSVSMRVEFIDCKNTNFKAKCCQVNLKMIKFACNNPNIFVDMASKTQFASKIGMIAATVGSAVGLGNVWRFPAEVQANGGAAFLLVYVACVLLLGIPVMLSEFALGRAGQSDAVGAFGKVGAACPWKAVGGLAVLASYMILCFYMVVAGWTFEYLLQSISGGLLDPVSGETGLHSHYAAKMDSFITDSVNPLVNTYMMILINIVVLIAGVRKGIERMSNVAMPLLFVILALFAVVSLSLPGASAGLDYFLHPDFSKITPGVVVNALGQAFFSLSLGMGILITYAAYYPKDTRLVQTSVVVSLLDLLVAVMMGLIIFPAVTTFGLSGEGMQGATLVFVTLPEVFAQLPATQLWAILFFLLLTLAALTSTISIAEVTVAFISDKFKIGRVKSCLIVLVPLFALSTVCSLSMGPWSDVLVCGMNIFDLLDNVATNLMLPIGSIFLCVYMGWFAPNGMFKDQLTNFGTVRSRLYVPVLFIVRYIAPLLICVVLVSYFIR